MGVKGILSYNLFAYCGNNPVCRFDNSGTTGDDAVPLSKEKAEALLLGGGAAGGALTTILLLQLLQKTAELTAAQIAAMDAFIASKKARAEEKVSVDVKAIEQSQDSAIYFGYDFYGGTMNCITGPMTFWEADAWATSIAASGIYTDRESWGLYTQNMSDAASMAVYLGCPDTVIPSLSSLVPDVATKSWHYSHFHTDGRTIHGISASSFHIWYGNPGG